MTWDEAGARSGRHFKREFSGLSLLLAVSSQGNVLFRFLDGPNNEATVACFLEDVVAALDKGKPDWRKDHVLLLDNCAAHKTRLVKQLIASLRVPTLYSAPASFLAVPVEGVFAAMKQLDMTKDDDGLQDAAGDDDIASLTHKQRMIIKVGQYLLALTPEKVDRIFKSRLRNLERFIRGKPT